MTARNTLSRWTSIIQPTIQQHYRIRKKHSLALNSQPDDHGDMNIDKKAGKAQRVRSFLRYAWGDQVAAHRALLEVQPYNDYLIHRRNGR
jgi:hypothetical protein